MKKKTLATEISNHNFKTVREVSNELRISQQHCLNLVRAGMLEGYCFGKAIRIPAHAVEDFLSAGRVRKAAA
jgi:excisionase family DNA binding protein